MKLSLIISAYNEARYIRKTLDSILGQTIKKFELIIVNDGSTDGTADLLNEILHGVMEIPYKIITKTNGGVCSARNRGLEEASGDYVMFLDGDDYIAEDLVESVCGLLEARVDPVDAVCWGRNTVYEDGKLLREYFDDFRRIDGDMTGITALKEIFVYRTMWICTGSTAIRRQLLTEHGLNYTEGCVNGEDQEFHIKVLSRVRTAAFINKGLTYYVQRADSVSNSYNIRKFDVVDALKRACLYLNACNDEDSKKMADSILSRQLVENYFGSLDSIIAFRNIKTLMKEMKEKYPGLNREMTEAMKSYREGKKKVNLKCRLYLISPEVYGRVVLLKRSFKIQKSGAMNK